MTGTDFPLPEGLPAPDDDGGADHLPGATLPSLTLPATDGSHVDLARLGPERAVLYVYPMTGQPGVALPDGWDEIPGARGCTPESCGFRDHFAELQAAGVVAVHGISAQDEAYQREVAARLALPFTLLSDERLALASSLRLPTFQTAGMTLYRRLTMIVCGGRIEHVFYPVFPPDGHAAEVLSWLTANPR